MAKNNSNLIKHNFLDVENDDVFMCPTKEIIDNLDSWRKSLKDEYDKIIEYFETNLIKNLYPSVNDVWLDYPDDPFEDGPLDMFSDKFLNLSDELFEDKHEKHLYFPVIVSSGKRDIQVGTFGIISIDIDPRNIKISYNLRPNNNIPKSYKRLLSKDVQNLLNSFYLNEKIKDTVINSLYNNWNYLETMTEINSDLLVQSTIDKFSLSYINDLKRIKNKSAIIIPYLETYVICNDIQKRIENSITVWCKENISDDVFGDVSYNTGICLISICSESDYGCSLVFDFTTQEGEIMWPGRNNELSSLGKKIVPLKNKLNDYIRTLFSDGTADYSVELLTYRIELETMMEDEGFLYNEEIKEDGETYHKNTIDFSKSSFPKEIYSGNELFECNKKNIDTIRDILPKLKSYVEKDKAASFS